MTDLNDVSAFGVYRGPDTPPPMPPLMADMPPEHKWAHLCQSLKIDPAKSDTIDVFRALIRVAERFEAFEGRPLPKLRRPPPRQ